MALQPKSNNLPEMQPEALAQAAGQVGPTLVPAGSENAVCHPQTNEIPKSSQEEAKQAAAAENELATPKQEVVAAQKEEKPVLGQNQQGKPSRTDNCHCPDVSQKRALWLIRPVPSQMNRV